MAATLTTVAMCSSANSTTTNIVGAVAGMDSIRRKEEFGIAGRTNEHGGWTTNIVSRRRDCVIRSSSWPRIKTGCLLCPRHIVCLQLNISSCTLCIYPLKPSTAAQPQQRHGKPSTRRYPQGMCSTSSQENGMREIHDIMQYAGPDCTR